MQGVSMKVMFVCMGNICRSPLAHAVFEDIVAAHGLSDSISVESSGTHAYHVGEQADPRMRHTAARHGTHIDHAARHFRPDHLREYDIIVAMDQDNLRGIQRMAEEDAALLARVHLMREFEPDGPSSEGVPDPYYGGEQGFETVYAIVKRCAETLFERIQNGDLPAR
jgi:protein-tyrosine phosphatase